jgi:hypothetical protein
MNEPKNQMKTKLMTTLLALGASLAALPAQDVNPPGDGQRPPRREGPGGLPGPGQGGPMMRPMPIIEALDQNKDGTIDASEIAKASEALKKLDKNGDGQLTPEEYRPRPGGPGPGGQGGRGGGGGPRGGGEGRPQRPPPPPE